MRFTLAPTADGSLTVFDQEAGECYKSRHAARSEAEHVFFGPGVRENAHYGKAVPFRVLELGLGLGTNLCYFASAGFAGEFLTLERDLAGAEFFLQHEKEPLLETLLRAGELECGAFRARLQRGDFLELLPALAAQGYQAHAILFDPFSPKANPSLWTPAFFALAATLLAPGGRLVTYSVSRSAKDAAEQAGLLVEKRRLPPELKKRGALLATKPFRG